MPSLGLVPHRILKFNIRFSQWTTGTSEETPHPDRVVLDTLSSVTVPNRHIQKDRLWVPEHLGT